MLTSGLEECTNLLNGVQVGGFVQSGFGQSAQGIPAFRGAVGAGGLRLRGGGLYIRVRKALETLGLWGVLSQITSQN